MTAGERDRVLELRAAGMSYQNIEALMGWPDAHGSRAHGVVNGRKKRDGSRVAAGRSQTAAGRGFDAPTARLSLWKAADGGRSRRKIHALLEEHGIYCEAPETGDLSPFEGRYDVLVYEEDVPAAEELLMRAVDRFAIQRLDNLSDRML